MNKSQWNFGRNVTIAPRKRYAPKSEQEVIEILDENKGQRIRCIGRLHSWSDTLVSEDVLLDLRHLNQVQLTKNGEMTVANVGGGCQIKEFLSQTEKQGWTLPSVGFITEQTVAGAISTGTHGSGRHSLSHYVTSIRVARYDSKSGKAVVYEITEGEELRAARCSLGSMGIILSVTMNCRETYSVEEHFQEYETLSDVLNAEKDFPLQQFYLAPWRWSYFGQHRREVDAPRSLTAVFYKWYRFFVLDVAMHLLIFIAVRIVRIHSFIRFLFRHALSAFVIRNRRFVTDSTTQLVMEHELFRHVEIEWFVRRDRLDAAMAFLCQTLSAVGDPASELSDTLRTSLQQAGHWDDLQQLRGTYCHHFPICVRKVLPDDTLISMSSNAESACGQESVDAETNPSDLAWYAITLTNYQRGTDREPFYLLTAWLTKSMSKLFAARPHWGKLCPLSPDELRSLYPAMDRFREVCSQADPHGVFTNEWTKSLFGRET